MTWIFSTFIILTILSLAVYMLMYQQISKIIDMQKRAFHFRSKAHVQSRSAKRIRYLYFITICVVAVYCFFAYISIFS